MSTWLVKYEPMMKVTTFSWKIYYFPQKNLETFDEFMETRKFVSLQWSRVNVSSIDTVDPAWWTENAIESMILNLDIDIQRKVRYEIKMRDSNTNTELTETVVQNMINKYNKNVN